MKTELKPTDDWVDQTIVAYDITDWCGRTLPETV